MRADIVLGREALEASAPDWRRLFHAARSPSPFQSPAWLLPWCRHLGRGEVLAVLIRDGSALVGLAAFTVAREHGARVLRPLGSGITDICDALAAAEREREIATAIVRALLEHAGWDRCVWDGLPTGSPLIASAVPLVQAERSEEIAPVLRIGGDAGRLEDAVPRAMAENLRACRKRADRIGGLSIHLASAEGCDAFLDSLFALHAARWRSGGGPGVLSHPAVQAFHRAALPALMQAGLARVHTVMIGGYLAAAHYGLAAGATHFYYIGGFDPQLGAAGPGHLAVAHAIERALQEGAAAFHFLRGDEAYKRRWGAQPDRLVTLSFSR
jgi:CelD/BcsL family acetyltransferase involved in cellulose biosynthesis